MDASVLDGTTATYAELNDLEADSGGSEDEGDDDDEQDDDDLQDDEGSATAPKVERQTMGSLSDYFSMSKTPCAATLHRGIGVADAEGAKRFKEAALLGHIVVPSKVDLMSDKADELASMSDLDSQGESSSDEDGTRRAAYLNTHEPFCLVAVGVQGAGKSHTLACALEACLVPFPSENVVRLEAPMTALVLHYDTAVTSVCEATGLLSPAPALARLLGPAAASSACVPAERAVVLVSPAYLKQRRAFYGDYCTVKPLLLRWHLLSADHIKRIMRIKDGDNQLYVAALLDLLRRYQANFPSVFVDFIVEIII